MWGESDLFGKVFRALCLTSLSAAVSMLSFSSLAFAESLITEIPLSGDMLTLRLLPKPSCVFGDADALQIETAAAVRERHEPNQTELLLTFEQIGLKSRADNSRPAPIGIRELTAGDLGKTGDTQFSLSALPKDSSWVGGMFICLSGQIGSAKNCASKQVVSYGEIFGQHKIEVDPESNTAQGSPHRAAIADKLYFFRPLFAHGGRLFMLSRNLKPEDYQEVHAFLDKFGVSGEANERVLQDLKKFGELGSLPLLWQGSEKSEAGKNSNKQNTLGVQLPFFLASKCSAS